MALTTGNTILWSDISAIMSNINTARQHCSLSTTSIAGGVGTPAKASNVSDLYNALRACNGVVLPAMGGTVSVASISIPAVGTLITPLSLTQINTEALRIAALNFSGFCTGNFGFGFGNSSFFSSDNGFRFGNSSFFSSDNSFRFGNSSFFSSDNSFRFGNSSFFSSDNSFRFGNSSFFSSNNGFGNSSNFSGNHGFSFSCSCNGFRFTCNSSCVFSAPTTKSGFTFTFR